MGHLVEEKRERGSIESWNATQRGVGLIRFDSRGYRFQSQLRGVRFMEVDSGPTQKYKKQRVKEIFGALPRNVSYVPMDFTKDNLLEELVKAGYSEQRKAFSYGKESWFTFQSRQ